MNIYSIVGTRPQYIKSSIISKKLRNIGINEKLIDTSQHYSKCMTDDIFDDLNIFPDYTLNIGKGLSSLNQIINICKKLEDLILKNKDFISDYIIVYGDTNSTLAAALTSSKLGIKLIHIESGERNYDKNTPEEINRIITDHLSNILFCSSYDAITNLNKENIYKNIYFVGDIMYDILLQEKDKILNLNIKNINKKLIKNEYILVTIHRQENVDNIERFNNIILSLNELSKNNIILFLCHPRTLKQLNNIKFKRNKNLIIKNSISYKQMLNLENNCKFIITDSGGVQRESFYFKKISLIPRLKCEWNDLIKSKWSIKCDPHEIIEKSLMIIKDIKNNNFPVWKSFYGEGNASYNILKEIC